MVSTAPLDRSAVSSSPTMKVAMSPPTPVTDVKEGTLDKGPEPTVYYNHAHLSYTGKKSVQSGLPLTPAAKPMTVTFGKTGTYTYHCDIHNYMTGTIDAK